MLLAVFIFVIVAAVVATLANDFVVPLMAVEDLTIGAGWARLREIATAEPWAFAGYLGMKLVLSIAAAFAAAIAFILAILVLAIPAVIAGVLIAGLVKGAGPVALVVGIAAAVVGIIVAVALFFILSLLVAAPIGVFFTSYSLYFLGSRYPRLGELLWPPLPAPYMPSPTPPPPLPGTAPAV
ncbi:MAG TPA: hypothetical protein VKW06_13725 [Candidatus Angelobacter sp.]|nr:hypothetical protein [Candidatus Angelobacter sp.]